MKAAGSSLGGRGGPRAACLWGRECTSRVGESGGEVR